MNRVIAEAWAQHTEQIKTEVLADVPRGVGYFQAEVTAVGTPAADGRVYANLRWQGKPLNSVLCNADLTLAVGNRVVVHLYDTDPVIAYRITK